MGIRYLGGPPESIVDGGARCDCPELKEHLGREADSCTFLISVSTAALQAICCGSLRSISRDMTFVSKRAPALVIQIQRAWRKNPKAVRGDKPHASQLAYDQGAPAVARKA